MSGLVKILKQTGAKKLWMDRRTYREVMCGYFLVVIVLCGFCSCVVGWVTFVVIYVTCVAIYFKVNIIFVSFVILGACVFISLSKYLGD
jgi:hypothetical protein